MERTGASHISYNNTARLMAGGYGNLRPPTLLQQRRKYEKLLNESKKYQDEIRARELRLEAYGWIRDAEEQGREPVPLLIEDSAWSLRTRLELRSRVHDDIRMQIARRVVRRKHQEKLIQV